MAAISEKYVTEEVPVHTAIKHITGPQGELPQSLFDMEVKAYKLLEGVDSASRHLFLSLILNYPLVRPIPYLAHHDQPLLDSITPLHCQPSSHSWFGRQTAL